MVRTTAVAYDDTPDTAPTEEHDLTQSVTTEIHAARAMRFAQAKRRYSTHTASVAVKPGRWNSTLGEGELIALQLDRTDLEAGTTDQLREWYWITSANTSRDGQLTLALEQCPVDALGRSLVALDVAAVTAYGGIWPAGDSALSCDADPSRATDCSIPPEDADAWTDDEVRFYGRYGRRPGQGEFVGGGFSSGPSPAPPAGPPGDSGGGSGGGGPAPLPPTGPVEPPGIPAQPGTPDGPANPPLPPQPPANFTKYVLLLAYSRISTPGSEIVQIDISVQPGQRAIKHFEDEYWTYIRIYNADGSYTNIQNNYQHLRDGTISGMWDWKFEFSTLTGV